MISILMRYRQIPGACWPASLTESASFKFIEKPVSEDKVASGQEKCPALTLASIYSYMHIHRNGLQLLVVMWLLIILISPTQWYFLML